MRRGGELSRQRLNRDLAGRSLTALLGGRLSLPDGLHRRIVTPSRCGKARDKRRAQVNTRAMDEQDYVSWLRQESMLADASSIAGQFSGTGKVWQNPFANPHPAGAIGKASVWFTAYPSSMITKPGHSFLGTLADEHLWRRSRPSASTLCTPAR